MPVTVPEIVAKKSAAQGVSVLTAYDATFARMFDEAGVDIILVGDSLGMVVQGHDSTLPVTVDDMVYHTKIVARVAQRALIVADLPFLAAGVSEQATLEHAGRLIKEAGASAVKLEGGTQMAPLVSRLVALGIPVMGHVGLLPQHVRQLGGFRRQGSDADSASKIAADALALQRAGAFAVVLEAIPEALAEGITMELSIPTIGIGSGQKTDGQVLVGSDMLGLTPGAVPPFVKPYAQLYRDGLAAAQRYCRAVTSDDSKG